MLWEIFNVRFALAPSYLHKSQNKTWTCLHGNNDGTLGGERYPIYIVDGWAFEAKIVFVCCCVDRNLMLTLWDDETNWTMILMPTIKIGVRSTKR